MWFTSTLQVTFDFVKVIDPPPSLGRQLWVTKIKMVKFKNWEHANEIHKIY